jgi:hypothetical protein
LQDYVCDLICRYICHGPKSLEHRSSGRSSVGSLVILHSLVIYSLCGKEGTLISVATAEKVKDPAHPNEQLMSNRELLTHIDYIVCSENSDPCDAFTNLKLKGSPSADLQASHKLLEIPQRVVKGLDQVRTYDLLCTPFSSFSYVYEFSKCPADFGQ